MVFEEVTKICEERKLAVTKLEEEAGLGRGTIGKWRDSMPTLTSLKKVADALGVPINRLIGG